MKLLRLSYVLILFAVAGCGQGDSTPAPVEGDAGVTEDAALGNPATSADEAMTVAATQGPGLVLTPQNTTIQFVGIHTNPGKPDPRTGKFTAFAGRIDVAESKIKSISADIETASLTTEIEKLTNHLKSADFFNVNEHPQATFVSTDVKDAGDGMITVTGDLTLLGKTQSITFPATVSTEDGISLKAQFPIDRTQFGMDYGTDTVAKQIAMTITVDG